MTYLLYGARASGSCAIECALAEIGADYEFRKLSLRSEEQRGAEYEAISARCPPSSSMGTSSSPSRWQSS